MIEFKYRPDIDGLRAVALGLVLLFHAGLKFTGGFVGVDVFFVISGFLITGLVIKQQAAGTFDLSQFWMRRIRRIVPAATFLVVATLGLGALLLLPEDLEDLADSTVAQQLMVANFYFWDQTGYFDGPADLKPLLHTWSLAVEEQFYLFFPLLLFVGRRLSQRGLLSLLSGLAAISFGLSVWGVRSVPTATFFLLPFRAWEMLLGGILVLLPSPVRMSGRLLNLCSWVGIGSILGAAWFYDSATPFPGASAAVPCLGTALLIYANSGPLTFVGRMLARRPVVFVGLISYSWYLWHWPLLVFPRYWLGTDLPLSVCLGSLAISFGCACLSWKYIETPFRRGHASTPFWRPLQVSAAATAVVVLLACVVMWTDGMQDRFPDEIARFVPEEDMEGKKYSRDLEDLLAGNLPRVGVPGESRNGIDCVLWGDSHAMAMGDLCDRLAREHGLQCVVAAHEGSVPLLGAWRPLKGRKSLDWNQGVLEFIQENNVKHVILASRWAVNIEGGGKLKLAALIADRESRGLTPDEARGALARGLQRTLERLNELGVRVWIVGQVPSQEGHDPAKEAVRAILFGNELPSGILLEEHLAHQGNVNRIFKSIDLPNVTVLDPTPHAFDDSGRSRICDEDGIFYHDDNHITSLGAEKLLAEILAPAFEEIARATGRRSPGRRVDRIADGGAQEQQTIR